MTLMLLVLAGCLQVKAGLQVNPGDTVSGQLTLFASKSELTTNGRTQEQGFADYRKQLPPLPEGVEAPYDDGLNYGVIVTYNHTPLSKFNGNIKIVRTGNQYTVTIGLDPNVIAAQVPNGNPSSTQTYLSLTSFEITVTMPGNVVSAQTNGTVIGQSDVAWNLAAGAAKPVELKAVSLVPAGFNSPTAGTSASAAPTASSSHTGLIIVIVIVVLVLLGAGGLVVLLLLRKRGGGGGSAPAPATEETKPPVPTG